MRKYLLIFIAIAPVVVAQSIGGNTSIGGNLFPPPPAATVINVTSTQAVLSYPATSSSACTIEVSEDPSYSPLVYDVDPLVFTGAGSDGLSNIGTRQFVVGKRRADLALDSNYYSRALQALTLHYYRITVCVASTLTGTFTTGNILMSSTYLDFVQMNPASPGDYIVPTLLNNRNQVIIDPYIGSKMTRVSLIADAASDGGGGTGPFLNFGGFIRATGKPLVNGGTGWLNLFPQGNGGFPELYFINSTTHAATYLGKVSGNLAINETDGLLYAYDSGTDALIQYTYTGTFAPATSGTTISTSNVNVSTTVSTKMQALNSICTAADYPLSLDQVIGDYAYMLGRRGQQDSYGCVVIVQISTGNVVGAARTIDNIQSRWCMIHNAIANGESASVFVGVHNAVGQSPNPLGGGPYVTTYSSGGTMPGGPTTITVSGEPACAGCGTDPDVPAARTGDTFHFDDGTNEYVTIVSKVSSTSWQISATSNAHTPGTQLSAACSSTVNPNNFPVIYWKFLLDPTGVDATNTNYLQNATWPVGGHDDASSGSSGTASTDVRITEDNGWVGRSGAMLSNLPNGTNFGLAATNTFAGATAICFGDGCRRHPSVGPLGAVWGTDLQIWDQVPYDASIANVSGSLYKYTPGTYVLNPRYFAIASRIGHPGGNPALWKSLLDISSATATLGTSGGDNYKMCIANATNECHNPSVKGDIFVNVPGSPNNCGSGGNPNADSPCLSNYNAWSSQVVQWGTDGVNARGLGGAVFAVMDTLDTPSAKTLPDGSAILFAKGNYQNNTPSQMLLVKAPAFTAPDGVDRTKFISIPITLTSPGGSVTNADIKFGYLEDGTVSQYYCTSRAETCVAISTSAPPTDGVTDPFKYIASDITNGSWSGLGASCTTTCTIILPVYPGHIVFYQAEFRNAGGSVVSTGTAGIAGDYIP